MFATEILKISRKKCMLYKIVTSKRYEKDVSLAKKRGLNIKDLVEVVDKLQKGEKLPPKNRDHQLHGDLEGTRECHIHPDWLLIYAKEDTLRLLSLIRTGTHSDLYGK